MTVTSPQGVQMQIRHFEAEDASSVEFVVLSVLQEWGFLPTVRDREELEALRTSNPFDVFFVAEDPDVGVVGCAGIVRMDDERCELRKIYLLKRFRGQSIGLQLLNACVEEAQRRNFKAMRLEVNSVMAQAVPFYTRNGFVLADDEKGQSPSADQVYYKALI
jgi:putative acetyltransferase